MVIGASDRNGAYPAADPQTPENFAATIYHALGIPRDAVWRDVVGPDDERDAGDAHARRAERAEREKQRIDDLIRRLAATRWPDEETTVGTDEPWEQGLPLQVAREFAAHWADAYDGRRLARPPRLDSDAGPGYDAVGVGGWARESHRVRVPEPSRSLTPSLRPTGDP